MATICDFVAEIENWVAMDGMRDCRLNVSIARGWEKSSFSVLGALIFLLHFLIQYGRIWQLFVILKEWKIGLPWMVWGIADSSVDGQGLREIVFLRFWGSHCAIAFPFQYGRTCHFFVIWEKLKIGLPWMGWGIADSKCQWPGRERIRSFSFWRQQFSSCISLFKVCLYTHFSWFQKTWKIGLPWMGWRIADLKCQWPGSERNRFSLFLGQLFSLACPYSICAYMTVFRVCGKMENVIMKENRKNEDILTT